MSCCKKKKLKKIKKIFYTISLWAAQYSFRIKYSIEYSDKIIPLQLYQAQLTFCIILNLCCDNHFRVMFQQPEVFWPWLSKLIQTVKRFGWLPSNSSQKMMNMREQDDCFRELEILLLPPGYVCLSF